MAVTVFFGLPLMIMDWHRISALSSLCFIMFYGGFNMKWSAARPVAVKAICLSTIGVVVTAGLTAVFCLVVLKFDFVDAFLMGAVLSSTDAASVFSVLRTKKLNLKDGTASILEMESGSNDRWLIF